MSRSKNAKFIILSVTFLGIIFCALTKGSVDLSLKELFSDLYRPILYMRCMRIVLGMLVGAGLGVCGVVLQAILKNPLAEPYLLGTSSGAGFGMVIAIIAGISSIYLPVAAFIGATLSIVLVYSLAREGGRIPVQSLILSGVIVAIALSGIIVFLVSVYSSESLHGILWWLLGSLQVYEVKLLVVVGTIVVFGIGALFIFSQDLNAISMGEEEAIHLGIDSEKIKKILFIITSLITGALVSVSGMIGFVGLIIPHMMRLFLGPNHRTLIPATCIGGAAFLVLCDTFARSLLAPIEIPIGVITSFIGAPLFIILLKSKQKIT